MAEQGGNLNEAAAFLWMMCYGVAGGFVFDLIGFVRRLTRPGGFSSFFIDLFYCLGVGIGFLLFLYAGWHGVIRAYWVLGAAAGFGLYYAGPGRGIRRVSGRWAEKIRRGTGRAALQAEQKINEIARRSRGKIEAYRARIVQKRKNKAG